MHNIIIKPQARLTHPNIDRELSMLDKRLQRILHTFCGMAWTMYKDFVVITRIYEPKDDKSTHHRQGARGPYRFVDCALLETPDMQEQERIRTGLNIIFPYDCTGLIQTIPPLDHGTAPHYHMQVRP
jgi:hypothetical protein